MTEMGTGESHFTELAQAQRLEAIGRFTGGIVHDFNNLLSVMLSYTTLILEDMHAKDPIRADLEEIKLAAERATELTRGLLAFSRRRTHELQRIDVNEVVAGLERIVRRIIGTDVSLTFNASPTTGFIRADASHLEQIVMNLVVNARDAMPSGGSLTIETYDVIEHDRACAVIALTDTGLGMTEETRARLFEPFYTTKAPANGTGLGLATVHTIVDELGGRIDVVSEIDNGTSFKVYLPKVESPAERPSAPVAPRPPLLRGTETVLVVEDQEQVRSCIRRTLTHAGYRVLEASNGGEALLICEQHDAPIHLLLTDIGLPRMNGRQLVDRVEALRPKMRILYMTANLAEAGDERVMAKPVSSSTLARRVRETLDAG